MKKFMERTMVFTALMMLGSALSAAENGTVSNVPVEVVTCNSTAVSCDNGLAGDLCGCNSQCGATNLCGLEYNGYINAGGMFNTHGAHFNGNHVNSDHEIGLDGAYLSVLKKAKTGCGCTDWGFGADFMFGRDARFLSGYTGWDSEWETSYRPLDYNNWANDGKENYGFAMPQLYGEMSVNNLSIKAGHLYTLMGYEGARADSRFFYGFGRNFEVTPITHTGAIGTYTGIENLDLSLGWVAGENNTFEREYDESLITGAATIHPTECGSVKYSFVVGDGAMYNVRGDLFRHDVTWTRTLTDRLDIAFVYNYGKFDGENNATWNNSITSTITDIMMATQSDNVEYLTFAGYSFYKLNDCWKLGSRLEWQKATSEVNTPVGNFNVFMETWNIGFGANWTPLANDNFVVRPEFRYDKDLVPLYGLNRSDDEQISLAFDVMCKF